VKNVVFIFGINSKFQYALTCRNRPPWKLKSPLKSGKSQYHPLGGDFAPVEDHWARRTTANGSHSRNDRL